MSATSVIGLQWGDEAKGKIVDLLALEHDIVVRYQGGNNAGHTVRFDGRTYKLSLLPVGILHPGVVAVIAPGVVVNPRALLAELDRTAGQNGPLEGEFLVSDRAHVIFPWHMLEEAALESNGQSDAIGTTMRGIGTCYRDKAGRTHAIRVGDLVRPDWLRRRVAEVVAQKNVILHALNPGVEKPLDADAIIAEYSAYAERIRPYVTDTTPYLHRALAAGKRILFEGAQGSLLDLDHGTFPFVTSSSSSGCGVHSGSGVPERAIERMIGVVKAYTTRVGGGPFPTELDNEIGQHIRDAGHEYGTVTGRPRRCGWFDAVAAGYGARISGVDSLAIALLDVLSGLEQLNICVAYEINGERTTDFPSHVLDLAAAKPVYETLPGWTEDLSAARTLVDLPGQTRRYVERISELLETRAEILSVGPDRDQTIYL
ncbi:MAG TPA: adenylosuccinate synthase [Planctomycetaceae bacterium]|nr:adenylosuccinate synthase [Planctomycetaceae bacterium]